MDIGIGFPNCVRGTTGPQLLEWARRAEAAGFTTLSSIGATSYPGYEELTVFAAAGAVTERIRFFTDALIAPARSTAELAKQSATVQHLTGGRLTLGLSPGGRESDFLLTGRDFHTRGRRFDQQLADLRRAWAGEALTEGTRPAAPPLGPRDGRDDRRECAPLPEAIRETIAAFAEAGVDELILVPSVSDPAQVDLLAEVALR